MSKVVSAKSSIGLLRVQDGMGRGPWRPNFSDRWTDPHRTGLPSPIYDDIIGFSDIVARLHKQGMHIGCAARGLDGLRKWFSTSELLKLTYLGFVVVDASQATLVAETPTQALIAWDKPLSKLPIYSSAQGEVAQ
jgi:hypothetical protein